MDDPKSSKGYFELPGGVLYEQNGSTFPLKNVYMREMTGEEEDLLMNRKISYEDRMIFLIANCITSIDDGDQISVTDKSQILKLVKDMMIVDLSYSILGARKVSIGNQYSFKVTCPENECKKSFFQTYDLDNVPIIKPIEPENIIWDVDLPGSGSTVKMKVMQAKDQKKARQLLNAGDQSLMTTALMTRVIEIDGKPPTQADLKKLPLKDRNKIRNSYQIKEGKIETDIDVVCNACDHRFTVSIEPQGIDFFFPSETQEF